MKDYYREYYENVLKPKRAAAHAQGLCAICYKGVPREGNRSCDECIAKARASRERRRIIGLCTRCGAEMDVRTATVCRACRDKERTQKSRTKAQRKAEGICTRCGVNRAREGFVECAECRELASVRRHADYEWFKSAGLCTQCHKSRARKGRTLCAECAAVSRLRYERRKEREHNS